MFDMGGEYHCYTADISRSFPVDGKFTEVIHSPSSDDCIFIEYIYSILYLYCTSVMYLVYILIVDSFPRSSAKSTPPSTMPSRR
jgi:hypothetical protein